MPWPRLPAGHDAGHGRVALARAQQAYHGEYASGQAGQLGQPIGSGSPNASSSGTLQNLISIPEGAPLQDADAVAAAFLVQGLQAEAGQHEMVGSPCLAPAPCSEQPQQQQQQGSACPGPAQAVPDKRGAAASPPTSPRAAQRSPLARRPRLPLPPASPRPPAQAPHRCGPPHYPKHIGSFLTDSIKCHSS